MKRILALFLTVLMILPLACACGQSELGSEEKATTETATAGDPVTEAETAKETGEVAMTPQNSYEHSIPQFDRKIKGQIVQK